MNNWKLVEIPFKMKDLTKDKRGCPIPFSIKCDDKGNPLFKYHDEKRLKECIINKRCAICGALLDTEIWLLAGIKIALHPNGAYIDPPMHKECATYALRVCPYLAQPSHLKRLPNAINESDQIKFIPGKPTLFALVKTLKYDLHFHSNGTIIMMPVRPFLKIEFWKAGEQISETEVMTFLDT